MAAPPTKQPTHKLDVIMQMHSRLNAVSITAKLRYARDNARDETNAPRVTITRGGALVVRSGRSIDRTTKAGVRNAPRQANRHAIESPLAL